RSAHSIARQGGARSDAEFVSKVSSSQQELEETAYGLELLIEGHVAPDSAVRPPHNEADELLAFYSTIIRTTKARLHWPPLPPSCFLLPPSAFRLSPSPSHAHPAGPQRAPGHQEPPAAQAALHADDAGRRVRRG